MPVELNSLMLTWPARRGARLTLLRALAATVLAAALGSPLVPAGRPAAAAPPADGSGAPGVYQFAGAAQALVFEGRGWGHGVGLCQWGARGRALAGQPAEEIVAAYYQGATIQKAVAPETPIRVLLHTGLQLAPGESPRITGAGGPWQLDTSGAPPVRAGADAVLELAADGAGPRYAVKDASGAVLGHGALRSALVLRPLESGTRFILGYKPAPPVPGRSGVHYDTYRGELVLSPLGDGLETVNRLSLEDYVRGVVPGEMPATWPAEALKAQTLAARSYAVWQARARAGERYDVDDTTRFQVYLGLNAERPNANQIVDATAGQVILAGGGVIQALFFSTCAGWTEHNETVWPTFEPLPYLRGIRDVDPNGRAYDAESPHSTWTTGALTAAQLEAMLNADPETEVGRLLSLDLSQRAPSGRLLRIRAAGTGGAKTFRPDVLMARFNRMRPPGVAPLRSTNFDLVWTTRPAAETQGGAPPPAPPAEPAPPAPPPTPQSTQPTPAPPPAPPQPAHPTPAAAGTPAYRLELTQPAPAGPGGRLNRYYAATGHNVGNAFLRYFDERGGLDVFGYPRTEEMLEDGKTVQYFQRAKFEYHADKAGTRYEVQLALLGDALTADRRPFPQSAPFANSAEHVYFPETGHGLHHAFLRFWRTRGGLDVFGYPISEELTEHGLTVQYFQRARFEYHPELSPAYHVSLGLLGDQLLTQRLWLQ